MQYVVPRGHLPFDFRLGIPPGGRKFNKSAARHSKTAEDIVPIQNPVRYGSRQVHNQEKVDADDQNLLHPIHQLVLQGTARTSWWVFHSFEHDFLRSASRENFKVWVEGEVPSGRNTPCPRLQRSRRSRHEKGRARGGERSGVPVEPSSLKALPGTMVFSCPETSRHGTARREARRGEATAEGWMGRGGGDGSSRHLLRVTETAHSPSTAVWDNFGD